MCPTKRESQIFDLRQPALIKQLGLANYLAQNLGA